MNKFKEKVLQEIIKFGRKNRRWKMPALIVAAVFLVIFHMVRSFFLQYKYHPFRQRLIAWIMAIVLLFGQMGLLSVLADSESGETFVISSFSELPDDVQEQTVLAGTAWEELTLPDTLEAAVIIPAENNPEGGEKMNSSEKSAEEGTEKAEALIESTENQDSNAEEAAAEETPAKEDDADSNGDGASSDEADTENVEIKTESHTSVLPEYQAENEAMVEPIENSKENNAGSTTENETGNTAENDTENETGNTAKNDTENTTEQDMQTETVTIKDVAWQSVPEYDADTEGRYIFSAVLPKGYKAAEGVSLPEIAVTVTDKNKTAAPDKEPIEGKKIKLLMRPYDEENSSDMVYYLLDSYDSYSWEIWNGWEWEELEYFEPELVVDKEQWYAYRFRCIAAKDGLSYTANAQDDWQIENSGIMLMAENALLAANSTDSGQSDYMFYDNAWSSGYFNVKGMDNGTDIQTTYRDRGYRTASSVDGEEKVDWSSTGETAMGNSLYGTRNISLVYSGRYAKITYTVENKGSVEQSFKVGSSADVMVGNNDYAPVVGSANGLTMTGSPKNDYTFNLVAPTADTLWYGYYGKAYSNIFTNLEDRGTAYSGDSGMAWSWSDTIAPGQTWSRYVLVGVGELPESPNAPNLTNNDPIMLQLGKTKTITGTADAGSTVVMEVGGEEFTGQTDENGNFSVMVTPSADMPDGETDINYYAVSEDGGISDVKTIKATVVSAPYITLTDDTVSVMEDSVLSDEWYRGFIKSSSGDLSYTGISTGTPGTYTVIYTAKRTGYTDALAALAITVLPQPLELSEVTASRMETTDSFNLSATLKYTGGEEIIETGFVWGVMQNPTISLNNGSKQTALVVTTKGGTLTVTAEQIADGVTYYARAYVKTAGGDVYYSTQKDFSINGKSYGSFTIKNNNDNTFTVTRTGGTDGVQMVYFRTVNGSAVGGTHFTHQNGTLTFSGNDTTQTITVTEQGVNTAYTGKPATAYSNADRTYSVEIYRVDGGGTLGGEKKAKRTMEMQDSYKVDRDCYVKKKVMVNESGNNKKSENNGVTAPAYTEAFIMNRYNTKYLDYLKETAYKYEMHMNAYVGEWEDCWEYLRFTSGSETAAIKFEIKPDEKLDDWRNGWFPESQGETKNDIKHTNIEGMVPYNSTVDLGTVFGFDINESPIKVEVAATGDGKNNWELGGCEQESAYSDIKEPKLIAIAPMAGGTYKAGDEVTISLIFDEIVDKTNSGSSGLSNASYITTNWGKFTYAGGADTNVLYFTGTIPENASGSVSVTNLDCAGQIRDMCSYSGTSPSASDSGSANVTVDNTAPTVSITNTSVINGTATAVINGTNTDSMKYTWSQNSTMPVTGWLIGESGKTVNTRQTSGTWYLHVLGTYNATGKTAYTSALFDFDNGASGSMPELTLSADNSAWAQSRTITIDKTPPDAIVKVKTPLSTTEETINETSYSATENGSYTFTLSSGTETVVKSITVSKIDKAAPEAVIAGPLNKTQSENVTLTITPTDMGGSGIKEVTGTWTKITDSGDTSTENAILTKNSDGTYSATTPGTAGNNYTYKLTVAVTDNAKNTSSNVDSEIYMVNLKVPTITVTKQSSDSSKAGDTYSYAVTENGNEITAIQLPDGTITTALSGTFTLTAPGTYYVTVSDAAGHVVRSEAMTVAEGVDGDAPDVRLYQQNENWTNEEVRIDVSIYEEGNIASAAWKKNGDASDTEISCSSIEDSVFSSAFSVTENGTYTVEVTDDSGNVGTDSIKVSNIDKTAPVIGVLRYSYEPKNLWDWLIGKDSLTIMVPVTEEGSGADEITYTMTSEGRQTEEKTAEIKEGKAEIILSPDFKGTVSITCTDKVGNAAQNVTVGEAGKGIILEDNAPEITFEQYTTASGITITVEDGKGSDVSTGLSSVTYKIGDGEEENVSENFTDSLKTSVSFEIKPEKIPAGGVDILVKAKDNAENQSEKTVRIEKYTVTYDYGANGGTSATSGGVFVTKTYDVVLSGEDIDLTPKAAREGWEFIGWNTNKDARTGLTSLQMGSDDITLYAVYSKKLTLTCYSGSAGNKQTETVTIYNNETKGPLLVPAAEAWGVSDENYEFYGYAASPNEFKGMVQEEAGADEKWYSHLSPDESTGIVYKEGITIYLSRDVTLYAVYRKTINISYNANKGIGNVSGQEVYKSANVADTVAYHTDSFTLPDGTGFKRNGCKFNGWMEKSVTGTAIAAGTLVTPIEDTTYYASWTEEDYTVTLHTNGGSGGKSLTSYTYGTGAILPADWTKTGYTFSGWYDNEECTGTKVTEIPATATGNKEYWAKWIDDIAPEIGTLRYSYEPKNLWDWLIGKKSLIIMVPVTEKGSGADKIDYTITPESGSVRNRTSSIANGLAKITISADFKGIIDISCTDKAGNTSPSVMAGADIGGMGIIIEDNAPKISFLADGSVPQAEYSTVPEITVTVTDDRENAISAGLASVSYQIGDGAETSVQQDFTTRMKSELSFSIAAGQIPAGDVEIIVRAKDNAGNQTEGKLTIHIHSGTLVEAKEAACTQNGNVTHYICSCGKRFLDSGCTKEVTKEEVTIPAKGHMPVKDGEKQSTCTKTGLTEGSHCAVCGEILKKQKVTKALGHDYSKGWQYNGSRHWKVCSRCGANDTKHSHVYDNDRDACCNACGYERTIEIPDLDEEQPTPPDSEETPQTPSNPKETPPAPSSPAETPSMPSNPSKQLKPAASEDDGKVTASNVTVPTGNVDGMDNTRTVLSLENGTIVVTVVCKEQEYTAGVKDTAAVANAVLTPKQIELVADGETIEIRIDVKDISDKVPQQDKDVIESGIKAYQKELPKLKLGMYIDISMFIKIGESGWDAVAKTDEPIEVVIGIPKKLQSGGRKYYIIRSHEGEHALLDDMDEKLDTITISTDLFSAYAIAYEQADLGSHKCGLCHICPTFRGICYFIWLAVIMLMIIFVLIILYKRNEKEKRRKKI